MASPENLPAIPKACPLPFILPMIWTGLAAAVIHLVLSWPSVLHFTTCMTGPMADGVFFYWQIWYEHFNLAKGHYSWGWTPMMYYPNGMVFSIRPLLATYSLFCLIGRCFYDNLIFWYNISLLLSSVATAMGVFVLAHQVTRRTSASVLAALLYTFCQRRFELIEGQTNLFSIEFLVWGMVAMNAALSIRPSLAPKRKQVRYWLIAGLLWALQVWQDPLVTIIFGLAWFIFALWAWWKMWVWRVKGSALRHAIWHPLLPVIIAAIAALPLFIAALGHLKGLMPGEYPWTVTRWCDYITPSARQALYEPLRRLTGRFCPLINRESAFIGYAAILGLILFVAAGGNRLRRARFWIFLSAATLVISLGFSASFFGVFDIPLPYKIFPHLPVIGEFRVPSRFNTLLMVGLSLLTALGWNAWHRRGWPASRVMWCIILIIGLMDGCFAPVALTPVRKDPTLFPDRLLEKIKNDPSRDFCVLTLPQQIEGPAFRATLQQTFHEHPIYDGYVTRWRLDYTNAIRLEPLGSIRDNQPAPTLEQSERMISVSDFRNRIRPSRVKYILLMRYRNPSFEQHLALLKHYFPVLSEESDTCWTLLTVDVEAPQ